MIRQLLFEAGARHLPPPVTPGAIVPSKGLATPETYIDPERASAYEENWSQPLQKGTHTYQGTTNPTINQFSLDGIWNISSAVRHRRLPRRLDHRHLPGPACLPRDDLGRQRPAHRSGAARRQADPAAQAGSDVQTGS